MTYSHSGNYTPGSLERTVSSSYSRSFGNSSGFRSLNYSLDSAKEVLNHSISADVPQYSGNLDSRISGHAVNLDSNPEFINSYSSRVGKKQNNNNYKSSSNSADYAPAQHQGHIEIITGFLKPNRPSTQFINYAEEVKEYVIETFEKLTDKQFPDNIVIQVCSEEELEKQHTQFGGQWNPGIQGFSINRLQNRSQQGGISSVFVKKTNLDKMMLVLGHEIGHVIAPTLKDGRDEEAKAFAFELAWMRTIQEHNIAELANSFTMDFQPAQNGLHNVAFEFVEKLCKEGRKASDVFIGLIGGLFSLVHESVQTD